MKKKQDRRRRNRSGKIRRKIIGEGQRGRGRRGGRGRGREVARRRGLRRWAGDDYVDGLSPNIWGKTIVRNRRISYFFPFFLSLFLGRLFIEFLEQSFSP